MLKIMIAAGAALTVAGTASAADIRVAVDPDADIVVKQVEWSSQAGMVAPDDRGMLSADELIEGETAEAIFGFDPDALIYIDTGRESGVRVFEPD